MGKQCKMRQNVKPRTKSSSRMSW